MSSEPRPEQVWQRVLAPAAPGCQREALRQLLLASREAAAVYQHLTARLTGQAKELARQLWQEEQQAAVSLRGLEALSGKPPELPPLPALRPQPLTVLVIQQYHQARRMAAEYAARSLAPELSPVLQNLSKQQERHCSVLARILGSL